MGIAGLCDSTLGNMGLLLSGQGADDGRRRPPGRGGIPAKDRLGKEVGLHEGLGQVEEAVKLHPQLLHARSRED